MKLQVCKINAFNLDKAKLSGKGLTAFATPKQNKHFQKGGKVGKIQICNLSKCPAQVAQWPASLTHDLVVESSRPG